MVGGPVAGIALDNVVEIRERLQQAARRLRPEARLHLVGVVAEHQMLAGAANIREIHDHRVPNLPLDPEMPLLGGRRLVLEPVPQHAGVRGVELSRGPWLLRDNRRKRVVNRPHDGKVERVDFVIHILGNRVGHLLPDHVGGGGLLRKIRDAESGAQNRFAIATQVIGEAKARGKVVEPCLLVDAAARTVLTRVDQPQPGKVEVDDFVVLLRFRPEDLVAEAGVDRQA